MSYTIRDAFNRGYVNERIGLELELESTKTQPLAWVEKQSLWTVHNDGSLRQNGIEYVFANPLWAGDIDAALATFEDNTKNVPFIDTGYGSTHVHYNVGHLYSTEVMSIVTGWSILEDAFLTLCKPSRDGNNFAQRFSVLNNLPTMLANNVKDTGRAEHLFRSINPDVWKYSNLNLATIRHLGTLEFRPYHSTWDTKEIKSWIDRIIAFCRGMVAIGNPVDVLQAADSNLEDFITKYAGVRATEKLVDQTRRNISTAFRLAYVTDKWEDIKELRAQPKKKKVGKEKGVKISDEVFTPFPTEGVVAAEHTRNRNDFTTFINTIRPGRPIPDTATQNRWEIAAAEALRVQERINRENEVFWENQVNGQ